MARHARREGDLVTEGKLSLENAKLYKAIMDKPKIRCASCGETFTRQDALKRHQAKQVGSCKEATRKRKRTSKGTVG